MGLLGVLTRLAILPACDGGVSHTVKPAIEDDSAPVVDSVDPADSAPPDADGDGFASDVDCDDADPAVHPGATDPCNGADDDCDDEVDEDAPLWHADADADGYGANEGVPACEQPAGSVADATDCDDADAGVYPEALDWCGDGADQDCDGADVTCAAFVTTEAVATQILGDDSDYYMGSWGQVDIGDVDADGLGDVLIGAAEHTDPHDQGLAYVLTSPVLDGTSTEFADALLLCGGDLDDLCGYGLAAVGDVDGDGVGDVVIGDPDSYANHPALLYRGPLTGTLDIEDAATVWYTSGDNSFGEDILGADLNGDGLSDVIVGDQYHSSGLAAALIFEAPFPEALDEDDDATARMFADGHYPPSDSHYLSVGGDVDGDGHADLVFGRFVNDTNALLSGAAFVFRGPFAGDRQPEEADAVILGTEYAQCVGLSADILADQDGDGRDEVLVSTSAEDAAGADMFLGGLSGTYTLPGDEDGAILSTDNDAFLGARLKSLDDLDGDGFGDLAFTGFSNDSNGVDSGSVFVYFGPLLGLHDGNAADLEIRGEAGENLGSNTGSGDADGDGITDLIVGAKGHPDAGAVYVITGADILAAVGR